MDQPIERDGYGRPLRGAAPRGDAPRSRSLAGAANLSFELVSQLQAVGIDSLERLTELGVREAWLRLRQLYPPRNSLQTLLALQGAVDDQHWDVLPQHLAGQLKAWREKYLADELTRS